MVRNIARLMLMLVLFESFYIPFAVAVIGTPGPANLVLMAAGARFGFRKTIPLIGGVIAGKQFIIWPLGFGLMSLAAAAPMVFAAFKWASIAYMLWLAWKVAGLRIRPGEAAEAPGFVSGLIVHPMNPKAWAMVDEPRTNKLGLSVVSAASRR